MKTVIVILGALWLSIPAARAQFRAGPGNPILGSPCCIAVGDFNGDGKDDVAVLNSSSRSVIVLLGDGLGGFSLAPGGPTPVALTASGLVAGDFNGDGKLDIAVGGGNGVTVLLGNGSGGFTATPAVTLV